MAAGRLPLWVWVLPLASAIAAVLAWTVWCDTERGTWLGGVLILATGVLVLAFAHERRDDGGYTLRLSPRFDDFPTSDATADTARVMAAIEEMARAAPAQYLWIHRRFKRQPGGEDPYAG